MNDSPSLELSEQTLAGHCIRVQRSGSHPPATSAWVKKQQHITHKRVCLGDIRSMVHEQANELSHRIVAMEKCICDVIAYALSPLKLLPQMCKEAQPMAIARSYQEYCKAKNITYPGPGACRTLAQSHACKLANVQITITIAITSPLLPPLSCSTATDSDPCRHLLH